MKEKQNSSEVHDLEPSLQTAVQSILSETVPEEAVERVKTRAKPLATSTKRDRGVLNTTSNHSNPSNVEQSETSPTHMDPERFVSGRPFVYVCCEHNTEVSVQVCGPGCEPWSVT